MFGDPKARLLLKVQGRGPAVRRWCAIESNTTASLGEAALVIPGYEYYSTVAPSDFDRLISGYRLTQTAFLGCPCCCSAVLASV